MAKKYLDYDGLAHLITKIKALVAGKADSGHTHSDATTSAAGFMSKSDKSKLDGIATGANKTTVDSALSSSSTNPVQNKVINTALAGKADSSHTHTPAEIGAAKIVTMVFDIDPNDGNWWVNWDDSFNEGAGGRTKDGPLYRGDDYYNTDVPSSDILSYEPVLDMNEAGYEIDNDECNSILEDFKKIRFLSVRNYGGSTGLYPNMTDWPDVYYKLKVRFLV